MEVLQFPKSPSGNFSRKGCNPILATQRSKMQSKRSVINQQLFKQMRLRNGAENLYNATSNIKVKETVALELSFVNSNLQLLKEELSDINSTVEPYQNKSGKATSIPMLPLGLKDTIELEFMDVFQELLSEHYGENPRDFSDELADLADMRTSVRTPARSQEGINLLLEYYNQLYFIENRFFSPVKPPNVFFRWYDCITGVSSVQRSVSLEKASILFNVGALYSQIGTRADRTRKKEIEIATDAFQRSAGVFSYLRSNYGNPLSPDLSPSFLSALTVLMLAQAQECELEHQILGGFEIELGKCVTIAQEAMKVSEKYNEAEKAFTVDSLDGYVPFPWVNMVQVKSHHYRALAHYYAGLGLLKQHELAEPVEIAKLLSTLYLEDNDADVPKPDDAARRKGDRRRLGKSHLRHAVYCHEQSLQTHSLCKMARSVDILKEYLQHAHQRSVTKFSEVDAEEDFFDLIETPSIHGSTDKDVISIPPAFDNVSSTDIFRRLGPLTVFSIHYQFGAPRDVKLTNQEASLGFNLHGDSPVSINDLNESIKNLGIRNEDVIVAVDDVDVKWRHHSYVSDLITSRHGTPVVLRLVTMVGAINNVSATTTVSNGQSSSFVGENNKAMNGNHEESSHKVVMRRHSYMKDYNNTKKRNSFGFLNSLKRRPKPNRFSTFSQNSSIHVATPSDINVTLQRKAPRKNGSFLRPGATLLRRKKQIAEQSTDF